MLVIAWWLTLKPSNDRQWQPDVAKLPWAEVRGEVLTLHNVRNFDYRTETDYVQRWETRVVNLQRLQGVDLFVTHWGVPLIAHVIVSFRFGDPTGQDTFLAMSIEARKTIGQDYPPPVGKLTTAASITRKLIGSSPSAQLDHPEHGSAGAGPKGRNPGKT
jgi:Domain of unknown function (DUF4105)